MKPSSIQEAIAAMRTTFPAAELRAWAMQSEDAAAVQAHFELGMWVRNNWVHGGGSPLATKIKALAWFIDDDGISTLIIKALWRVLNGQPCPSIEELLKPSRRE